MKTLSVDLSFEAQRKQVELIRRLSPAEKISLACALTETMRGLILIDIRQRFPQADASEIRRRFIARVLVREDVIRAYGFDPKAEGY
jgi:hypothetical protein